MIDLTQHQELIIRQHVEYLEAFSGFETENRYSVSTPEGEELLYAYEESGFFSRQFLSSHRPLSIHVIDDDGQPVMTASRSFFWFLSHLHFIDADEREVGSLRRKFAVLGRKFELEDGNGDIVAELKGGLLRPNTFMFYKDGEEVARITKQWGGILREIATDADTFKVQMDTRELGQDFALMVLGTAFAIDLDFFESKGGGGGF